MRAAQTFKKKRQHFHQGKAAESLRRIDHDDQGLPKAGRPDIMLQTDYPAAQVFLHKMGFPSVKDRGLEAYGHQAGRVNVKSRLL